MKVSKEGRAWTDIIRVFVNEMCLNVSECVRICVTLSECKRAITCQSVMTFPPLTTPGDTRSVLRKLTTVFLTEYLFLLCQKILND